MLVDAGAPTDVDFIVASDEENVGRLRVALRSVVDDPSIDEIDAAELAGEYPVVQYFPPNAAYSVDIIARDLAKCTTMTLNGTG